MRINVYSQELTDEVLCREEMAQAFEKIAELFRTAPPETGLD